MPEQPGIHSPFADLADLAVSISDGSSTPSMRTWPSPVCAACPNVPSDLVLDGERGPEAQRPGQIVGPDWKQIGQIGLVADLQAGRWGVRPSNGASDGHARPGHDRRMLWVRVDCGASCETAKRPILLGAWVTVIRVRPRATWLRKVGRGDKRAHPPWREVNATALSCCRLRTIPWRAILAPTPGIPSIPGCPRVASAVAMTKSHLFHRLS